MRKKIVLSMCFLSIALSLLTSQWVNSAQHAVKYNVALIVSKPANLDPEINQKNITNKGYPVDEEGTETLKPDDEGDYFNRGVVHDRGGLHKEAIESYKQAVMIKPDYAEAHYNLAVSYLMSNDNSSAHGEYMLLKKIDAQMADNLYKKAAQMALSGMDSNYIMQAGAFRNLEYANDMVEKIKVNYLNAYIEQENGFNKVRILGIKNKGEADLIIKDINNKFKVDPFLLPAH
ncbi:MAG: tetratricopeptide repeat protein [Nitrospirae bacterium]|nr:tetratricopeptide repeat protein [Nitrospirota bacterium]